jgi:hypothetical protein
VLPVHVGVAVSEAGKRRIVNPIRHVLTAVAVSTQPKAMVFSLLAGVKSWRNFCRSASTGESAAEPWKNAMASSA